MLFTFHAPWKAAVRTNDKKASWQWREVSSESLSEILREKSLDTHPTLHRILNTLSLSRTWLPWSPGGLNAVRDLTNHLGRRQGSALDTGSFSSPCRPPGAEPRGQLAMKHHSVPSSPAHGFPWQKNLNSSSRLSPNPWLSGCSCCAKDRRPRHGFGF